MRFDFCTNFAGSCAVVSGLKNHTSPLHGVGKARFSLHTRAVGKIALCPNKQSRPVTLDGLVHTAGYDDSCHLAHP